MPYIRSILLCCYVYVTILGVKNLENAYRFFGLCLWSVTKNEIGKK